MWSVLTIIVIGLIIANVIAFSYYGKNIFGNILRHIGYSLIGLFLSVQIGVLLVFTVFPKFGWTGEGEYDVIHTYQFETVYDNGEFTFGSEMVDDELMYCYYKNPSNGNIDDIVEKVYIHADLTTIHQVDTLIQPYIDIHIVSDKDKKWDWFPISSNNDYQKYDIYIPKIK